MGTVVNQVCSVRFGYQLYRVAALSLLSHDEGAHYPRIPRIMVM